MNDKGIRRLDVYGCSSDIYLAGEEILKVYKVNRGEEFRIKREVIEFLKSYRNYCFLHINSYECDKNGIVTSYKYDYIPEVKTKLVDLQPEYIYASLKYLDKLAIDLANEGISIDDNHEGNILTSPDGLIVIDPDRFAYDEFIRNVKDLTVYNKRQILGYIKNKISYECGIRYDLYSNGHKGIFEFEVDENTDLSYEIKERIKGKNLRGVL